MPEQLTNLFSEPVCNTIPQINSKLRALMAWAEMFKVDLDRTSIGTVWDYTLNRKVYEIQFNHGEECAANLRALKRACDGLEATGTPPYVTFGKTIEFGDLTFNVKYSGSMTCDITYNCKPKSFPGGEPADGLIEDVFKRETRP